MSAIRITSESKQGSMTMRYGKLIVAGLVLVGSFGLATHPRFTVQEATASSEAVHVEAIEGTDFKRVALSERAAERLGMETAPVVADEGNRTSPLSIPYSAVMYDANGETWAYTTSEHLVFVREAIGVERIDGGIAYLTDGPAAGTEVVTVGSAELFGAERYGH